MDIKIHYSHTIPICFTCQTLHRRQSWNKYLWRENVQK